jgi:rhodanese-related sulfurtransferase
VELIGTEELKEKLDRADDFELAMVLGDCQYRAMHIPGSLSIASVEEGLQALDPDDEVVVYDSGPSCVASRRAYRVLKNHGYEHVRRYAGGLEECKRAGHPLEGTALRRGQSSPGRCIAAKKWRLRK